MADTHSEAVPRAEYPRPQFVRADWLNLNGAWRFSAAGADGLPSAWQLDDTIIVPFAIEAELSGIGDTDFHRALRYQRDITVPTQWAGQRLLLNFGAADFDTTVWVDDVEVGRHRGGFTSFTFDITSAVTGPSFVLSVLVEDDPEAIQARGKQSRRLEGYEAFYNRTTGIWQTVWLEPVSQSYLRRPAILPDVAGSRLLCELDVAHAAGKQTVRVDVYDGNGLIVTGSVAATSQVKPTLVLDIPADRLRLWSPEDPFLYDVCFTLSGEDGVLDTLDSYAGMRSVAIEGRKVLLNGRPVFQRLVLDQGFWPDGLMTAPSDDDLVKDITIAQEAGFNGARMHQKVFEERYLYHADRLGYLVWGEFGDWGARVLGTDRQEPTLSFVAEWIEAITRDLSHPAIIGWCPLNETFEPVGPHLTTLDDATKAMYSVTKAIDPTRVVLDASGYSHRVPGADIYDSHLYEQDPVKFARLMGGLADGTPYTNVGHDGARWSVAYADQPYFCSEFGGTWWSDDDQPQADSWGYGLAPSSRDEWIERFRGLVKALADDPNMFGYCFTQLTDVFQEKNGIVTFARQPKFDLAVLKQIQSEPTPYENGGSDTRTNENDS